MKIEQKMSVAEQNAWFAGLTPKEQRIQLAKDVLEQLEAERIRPSPGVYVDFPLTGNLQDLGVQEALLANTETCNVCAKGALFVARVAGYDNFRTDETLGELAVWDDFGEVHQLIDDDHTIESLKGIFTREQVDLIENAFEGKMLNYYMAELENNIWAAAAHMYEFCSGTASALAQIMENILANDGVFLVPGYEDRCRERARVDDEL